MGSTSVTKDSEESCAWKDVLVDEAKRQSFGDEETTCTIFRCEWDFDCFCATGRHLGSNDPAYQEKESS